MGKKDNRIPQKKHNTSVLECENEQIDEKPENELKRITRKDREQTTWVKKSLHEMDEKLYWEVEILERYYWKWRIRYVNLCFSVIPNAKGSLTTDLMK